MFDEEFPNADREPEPDDESEFDWDDEWLDALTDVDEIEPEPGDFWFDAAEDDEDA